MVRADASSRSPRPPQLCIRKGRNLYEAVDRQRCHSLFEQNERIRINVRSFLTSLELGLCALAIETATSVNATVHGRTTIFLSSDLLVLGYWYVPRNLTLAPPVGLRAFRFLEQSRPGSPLGSPFLGRLWRGRRGILQLAIGPLLAGLPVVVDVAAELAAGFDLFLDYLGLGRAEKAGMSPTRDGSGQAVVRTVPCLGVPPAGTAWLTALDPTFGKRTPPHGFELGKTGGEFAHARWNIRRSGHAVILLPYMP